MRGFLIEVPPIRKPLKLCLFTLKVLYDIVVANVQVAKLVLGPKDKLRPAFVEVPMAIGNEFALATLTSIISLTPGTVSACLSADRRVLMVHALDVPDVDALISDVKRNYEAPLLEIFECSPICDSALHGRAWNSRRAERRSPDPGPDMPDRVLALDTLYINALALIVLFGIWLASDLFFEAALLIAVMGFVSTVAVGKHMLHGDIID